MAGSVSAPKPGDLFGERYRLDAEIIDDDATGWWRAEDTQLNRPVTIRIPRADLMTSPDAVDAFRAEAADAARLRHPAIISVHDTVTNDEDAPTGLVMDPLPATNLHVILRDRPVSDIGRRGLATATAILNGVGPTLAHAHESGVFHGLLRPAVIGVDPDWEQEPNSFTVAGFGSRWHQASDMYISPEHAAGDDPNVPGDVYSLAAILYEALSGHRPDRSSGAPTRLHHVSKTPWPVADVVMRALDPEPADRPVSIAEFQSAFHDAATPAGRTLRTSGAAAGPTTQPTPLLDTQRRRTRRLAIIGLGVLAALVAIPLLWSAVREGPSTNVATAAATTTPVPEAAVEPVELVPASPTPLPTEAPSATPRPTPSPTPVPPLIREVLPFDPPPGSGGENDEAAPFVFDDDPETVWTTEIYGGPTFGNLKTGVGMWIALDRAAPVNMITIDSGMTGWTGEVYVADDPAEDLEGWGEVAEVMAGTEENGGLVDVVLTDSPVGGAVLLWFTELAQFLNGGFGVSIRELTIQ